MLGRWDNMPEKKKKKKKKKRNKEKKKRSPKSGIVLVSES